MSNTKGKFIIKIWNGSYGNKAKFIIQDTTTKKYAEFAPTRPKDLAWTDTDVTKEQEYKSWKDFEDEPISDLNEVVF